MPDIGLPPPRRRCRSVYGTLNLPQGGRQVLGADLNCSESGRGGPPFHEASVLNKPRWPRRPAPWSKARPTFGARVRRAQLSKGSEIMPRPRTRSASNPAGHCAAIVPVSPHAGVIQRSAPSQLRSLGLPPSGTSPQRGDETCFEKIHRDCHHRRNRCSFARTEEHHGA
jgi:hypothetical protein